MKYYGGLLTSVHSLRLNDILNYLAILSMHEEDITLVVSKVYILPVPARLLVIILGQVLCEALVHVPYIR